MKYRKKPVVIDAIRWQGDNISEVKNFIHKLSDTDIICCDDIEKNEPIYIKTLEGEMKCEVGDWIIRGVKNELYPCKNDIFKDTYDPVY